MKKFLWIIPVISVFCIYSIAFNNYFVYDDFIWLYRAKTLGQNWKQIVSLDVIYFDPLIYLMFLVDYSIAGLNPVWYHTIDLIVHAFNAYLVYKFAKMLACDEKAGLYGSILFASSFAIADAVLWSSSRVDLVSVMFSLGSLIQFLKYLRTDKTRYQLLSCLLFILALGAKGTPVVMPFMLIWLIIMEKKPLRRYMSLVPFVMLVTLYFALLMFASHNIAKQTIDLHLNIRNFCLALSEFFVPERYVAILNPYISATVFALLLITSSFLRFYSGPSAIKLLYSPNHRIYFASVGFALIGGGVLQLLEQWFNRLYPKAATTVTVLFLAGIVVLCAIEVRKRNQIWEYVGVATQSAIKGLISHRDKIVEGGVVGLVQFPGSDGFMSPMIKLYLGLNEITTVQFNNGVGMIKDQDLLEKAEKSSFFMLKKLGNNIVTYDLSDQFKKLLIDCRQAKLNPSVPEFKEECKTIAMQLTQKIVKP
ncbi:MAG: hypothetical protein ABSA86_08930 [Oryzomonas sp.]